MIYIKLPMYYSTLDKTCEIDIPDLYLTLLLCLFWHMLWIVFAILQISWALITLASYPDSWRGSFPIFCVKYILGCDCGTWRSRLCDFPSIQICFPLEIVQTVCHLPEKDAKKERERERDVGLLEVGSPGWLAGEGTYVQYLWTRFRTFFSMSPFTISLVR